MLQSATWLQNPPKLSQNLHPFTINPLSFSNLPLQRILNTAPSSSSSIIIIIIINPSGAAKNPLGSLRETHRNSRSVMAFRSTASLWRLFSSSCSCLLKWRNLNDKLLYHLDCRRNCGNYSPIGCPRTTMRQLLQPLRLPGWKPSQQERPIWATSPSPRGLGTTCLSPWRSGWSSFRFRSACTPRSIRFFTPRVSEWRSHGGRPYQRWWSRRWSPTSPRSSSPSPSSGRSPTSRTLTRATRWSQSWLGRTPLHTGRESRPSGRSGSTLSHERSLSRSASFRVCSVRSGLAVGYFITKISVQKFPEILRSRRCYDSEEACRVVRGYYLFLVSLDFLNSTLFANYDEETWILFISTQAPNRFQRFSNQLVNLRLNNLSTTNLQLCRAHQSLNLNRDLEMLFADILSMSDLLCRRLLARWTPSEGIKMVGWNTSSINAWTLREWGFCISFLLFIFSCFSVFCYGRKTSVLNRKHPKKGSKRKTYMVYWFLCNKHTRISVLYWFLECLVLWFFSFVLECIAWP